MSEPKKRPGCPDGGVCHHGCDTDKWECWRVAFAEPLTSAGFGHRWPVLVVTKYREPTLARWPNETAEWSDILTSTERPPPAPDPLRAIALQAAATRRAGLSEVWEDRIAENTIADAERYLDWLRESSWR